MKLKLVLLHECSFLLSLEWLFRRQNRDYQWRHFLLIMNYWLALCLFIEFVLWHNKLPVNWLSRRGEEKRSWVSLLSLSLIFAHATPWEPLHRYRRARLKCLASRWPHLMYAHTSMKGLPNGFCQIILSLFGKTWASLASKSQCMEVYAY